MSSIQSSKVISCAAFGLLFGTSACFAAVPDDAQLSALVNAAVTPVMQQQNVPGLTVALTINGKAHYVNSGVASKDT